MDDNMKENGIKTKCTDREFSIGLMEGSTSANIKMIKNAATVNLLGLTDATIVENGVMGNSMGKVHTSQARANINMVSGKMARGSDGLEITKNDLLYYYL
jgi:hypothetical protein